MRLFIQAISHEVAKVIVDGPTIPKKKWEKKKYQRGKWVRCQWPQAGSIQFQGHAHSILCIGGKWVYKGVVMSHEGTNRVKETKVGMLTHEYELFLMQLEESISEIYNRFTTIITNLKSLEKNLCKQIIGEKDS